MGAVSVDPVPAHLESAPAPGEGLRERKKRMMRPLISDTATAMFLERGFDEVRVAEVAAACDVSEKTVYNYFPTKESLVLDREEPLAADIRRTLGPGGATMSPIQAAVGLIAAELGRQYDAWGEDADQPDDLTMIQRFAEMLE